MENQPKTGNGTANIWLTFLDEISKNVNEGRDFVEFISKLNLPNFAGIKCTRRFFYAHAKSNHRKATANNWKWRCQTKQNPCKCQRNGKYQKCCTTSKSITNNATEHTSNRMNNECTHGYGKKYKIIEFERNGMDWAIQSQDDCAAVMCIVSLGFNSVLIPTNALITIAEKAVNSPKLTVIMFFAVEPKIFKEWKNWNFWEKLNEILDFLPVEECGEMCQSFGCRNHRPLLGTVEATSKGPSFLQNKCFQAKIVLVVGRNYWCKCSIFKFSWPQKLQMSGIGNFEILT